MDLLNQSNLIDPRVVPVSSIPHPIATPIHNVNNINIIRLKGQLSSYEKVIKGKKFRYYNKPKEIINVPGRVIAIYFTSGFRANRLAEDA